MKDSECKSPSFYTTKTHLNPFLIHSNKLHPKNKPKNIASKSCILHNLPLSLSKKTHELQVFGKPENMNFVKEAIEETP